MKFYEEMKEYLNKLKSYFIKEDLVVLGLFIIGFFVANKSQNMRYPTATLGTFLAYLSSNIITNVSYFSIQNILYQLYYDQGKIYFKGKDFDWTCTHASLLSKDKLFDLVKGKQSIDIQCSPIETNKKSILQGLLSGALSLYVSIRVMTYNNLSNQMKKDFDKVNKTDVSFNDIYGLDKAKVQLKEIIDYLKEPEKYTIVGARLRHGILLYGKPGTGKTMLAKATATESNSNFLYVTASEFIEQYVGVGPKRVRELFKKARSLAPCIVFIDEIDGIGGKRQSSIFSQGMGGETERSSTLNQLLTEMDGFETNKEIVVIGATNRINYLDGALLRSGRFDTKLDIKLPNDEERVGILNVHLKKKNNEVPLETLKEIGKRTNGCNGADMENIVNESAYLCVQRKRQVIKSIDILDAFRKFKKERQFQKSGLNQTIMEQFIVKNQKEKRI